MEKTSTIDPPKIPGLTASTGRLRLDKDNTAACITGRYRWVGTAISAACGLAFADICFTVLGRCSIFPKMTG